MLPAIQVTDEAARVHDPQTVANAIADCKHQLPGASNGVWRHRYWQVSEQAYDLPDVYVSYIEVRAYSAETTIPIQCPRHDLYWLYVLQGRLNITAHDRRKILVSTTENRYRVAYLPTGRYGCRFKAGTHRLLYVVHKPSALFREESPEFDIPANVIAAVKDQLAVHAVSAPLPMQDGAAESIERFLHAPGQTFLRRKQALQNLSLDLIFCAHESLGNQAGQRAVDAEWAVKMKNHIDASIESGEQVNMHTVARHFRISVDYVRLIFKSYLGEPIGSYISGQKLEVAARLLAEGSAPSVAARYVGWTPAYFSRAYKARFGAPPKKTKPY